MDCQRKEKEIYIVWNGPRNGMFRVDPETVLVSLDCNSDTRPLLPDRDRTVGSAVDTSVHSHDCHIVPHFVISRTWMRTPMISRFEGSEVLNKEFIL